MDEKILSAADIGNYYGGLEIKEEGQKYYWGIENYDGTDFEEITKSLYDEIVKFETKKIIDYKRKNDNNK